MLSPLIIRYMAVLLLLVPTTVFAILPIRENRLRYNRVKTIALLTAVVALTIPIVGTLGYFMNLSPNNLLLLALIPLLFVFLHIVKAELFMKLFCFFDSTMIVYNALVYGILLAAPFEINDNHQFITVVTALICFAVSAALGALYFKTLTVKIPFLLNEDRLNIVWENYMVVTFVVTALFYWVTPRSPDVVMTGRVRITILIFLLLGPVTYMLVFQALYKLSLNVITNVTLSEENELMSMERKRYKELRAYMDETRSQRHDFRQHLLVMDGYAKAGEIQKLIDYIEQFTSSLADHRSNLAANPAVDAVASHYDGIAKSAGIHIKWYIELPAKLPVKESDFITIFGNLLENALNAVKNLPEDKRSVNLTARMLSDAMLGITVRNPYEGEIKKGKDGLPRTSKAGHGIGLTSVRTVVNRYHGVLDINTDDGIFTAGVLLYL
ncbi:MAG: GHKL domain-containing protein [Mogibacterium sp.]|nr:GHKL domain-containing protein [Mogibacterium sp.]